MRFLPLWCLCLFLFCPVFSCVSKTVFDTSVRPADTRPENYCHLMSGKRVGLVINQTSVTGDSTLLDILLRRNVHVVKIFVPEHGFRGKEDAGTHIGNTIDSATQLPVISLYGNHKKPTVEDINDIDIMVYDLQDVGVRFYTYISTLEYCMEACAQQKKSFLVLDRPDPNGFYVDGPVLEVQNRSFVGMQPIPVVYGMTAGEYAMMLKGERWFADAASLELNVIRCVNYDHGKKYRLPVPPSPNLHNMAAVYAYPSLCLFEGTKISVGRGTEFPFQQYGSPAFEGVFNYMFMPVSGPGAKTPLYENRKCYGEILGKSPEEILNVINREFQIKWLIKAFRSYPEKDHFFNDFFVKLSGTETLKKQIAGGADEAEIRRSWQKDLAKFRRIRKKYLLYKDF